MYSACRVWEIGVWIFSNWHLSYVDAQGGCSAAVEGQSGLQSHLCLPHGDISWVWQFRNGAGTVSTALFSWLMTHWHLFSFIHIYTVLHTSTKFSLCLVICSSCCTIYPITCVQQGHLCYCTTLYTPSHSGACSGTMLCSLAVQWNLSKMTLWNNIIGTLLKVAMLYTVTTVLGTQIITMDTDVPVVVERFHCTVVVFRSASRHKLRTYTTPISELASWKIAAGKLTKCGVWQIAHQ